MTETPLLFAPLACIDFEATDFADAGGRVVSVAVVHVDPDEGLRVAFHSLVRPPSGIDPDAPASRVHGLTNADVEGAPSFGMIAEPLLAALAGRVVVAYGAPADFVYLRTELHLLGMEPPTWPWVDLLVVRRALKTRGGPGRLAEVAAQYGVLLSAHGALGDATATALIARRMLLSGVGADAFSTPFGVRYRAGRFEREDEDDKDHHPPAHTVGSFLAWQREAALWQERGYADYRHREGDARPPRAPWHELEGVSAPTWSPPLRTRTCHECLAPAIAAVDRNGVMVWLDPDLQPHDHRTAHEVAQTCVAAPKPLVDPSDITEDDILDLLPKQTDPPANAPEASAP